MLLAHKASVAHHHEIGGASVVARGVEADFLLQAIKRAMGQQSLLQAHAIGAPHMRLQRSGGHVIRQDADVLRLPVEALAIGGNERLVGNRGIVAVDVLHNAQSFHRLASLLDEVRGARPHRH